MIHFFRFFRLKRGSDQIAMATKSYIGVRYKFQSKATNVCSSAAEYPVVLDVQVLFLKAIVAVR